MTRSSFVAHLTSVDLLASSCIPWEGGGGSGGAERLRRAGKLRLQYSTTHLLPPSPAVPGRGRAVLQGVWEGGGEVRGASGTGGTREEWRRRRREEDSGNTRS